MASDVAHLVLDRDGVINREAPEGWVTRPEQWSWLPGSLDALVEARRAGVAVSVVTNQSVVGRGGATIDEVERLHAWVLAEAERAGARIDRILVCPHAPTDGCGCRKPLPGLVRTAVDAGGVDDAACLLVGDDLRDLEAAQAAGIAAVLVLTGKGRALAETARARGVAVATDLAAVVRDRIR